MTYTEACKHNAKFCLPTTFKADKEYADGIGLKWVIDPMGRIGYIKAYRPDALLVHYPVKSFKVTIRICVQSWDISDRNNFRYISRRYSDE